MADRPLPEDLVSLIHHVELSEAGWRIEGLEQMAIAASRSTNSPLAANDLAALIHQRFGINIGADATADVLRGLVKKGRFLETSGKKFRLSEAFRQEVQYQVDEGNQLERRVEARFSATLITHGISESGIWIKFNNQLLSPLVAELGAKTYELISGTRFDLQGVSSYRDFLTLFDESDRTTLAEALDEFLDPQDNDVRAYVLRHLYSRFLLEALQLSGKSVKTLGNRLKGGIKLNVFVDTNFLFSILGLHDNPSNQAARALHELVTSLPRNLAIKFYVLPITIAEARHTLIAYKSQLEGIPLSPNLSRGAKARIADLSGITAKFVQAAEDAKWGLSAEEYFGPYVDNILPILRAKGVEIYNEDTSDLRTEQTVIDDLLNRVQFEERVFAGKAKTYEAIEHDMILWHFVKRKRPVDLESPLDALYWVTTLDFRFIGFDSYKNRQEKRAIAVCLHPSILLQMLQFWLPRTEEFEAALISSLRPMLPHRFNTSAETVTIKILRALSHYEGISDLGEEVVAAILMNRALRQRMTENRALNEEAELVKEALVEETERLRERLQKRESEKGQLDEALRRKEAELEAASKLAEENRKTDEQRIAALTKEIEEERSSRISLEALLQKRERDAQAAQQIKAEFRERTVWSLAVICSIIGLPVLLALLLLRLSGWSEPKLFWSFEMTIVLAIAWLAEALGSKRQNVKSWPLFMKFTGFRRWIFGTLWAIILGLISTYLWEIFKT